MRKIFNNYEIVIVCDDEWIENKIINLKLYKCLKAHERGVHFTRKVKFDKDAGDLYIKLENKKYFLYEFK